MRVVFGGRKNVFAQPGPKAGMVRVGEANSRLRALGSVGIAVNNVINGGKNDLRRNGLAG